MTHVSRPDSAAGVQEHDYPDVLPGSRRAVVMLWKGSISSNHIGVIDLASGTTTELTEGSMARYVAPGFLAIGTADGRVLAARFDPRSGRLLGTPAAMLQDVRRSPPTALSSLPSRRLARLSISGRPAISTDSRGWRVTARERQWTPPCPDDSRPWRLSPDGTQIAVARNESGSNPDLDQAAHHRCIQPSPLRCQRCQSPSLDTRRSQGGFPRPPVTTGGPRGCVVPTAATARRPPLLEPRGG